jgi:hypothetical protein
MRKKQSPPSITQVSKCKCYRTFQRPYVNFKLPTTTIHHLFRTTLLVLESWRLYQPTIQKPVLRDQPNGFGRRLRSHRCLQWSLAWRCIFGSRMGHSKRKPCNSFRSSQGRPAPLIEVAFDTTQTVVGMIYKGIFSNFPKIRFVIAHARGYVPILSDRLALLRTKS